MEDVKHGASTGFSDNDAWRRNIIFTKNVKDENGLPLYKNDTTKFDEIVENVSQRKRGICIAQLELECSVQYK